jgi:murein L,D-transpeptidase YcbB/YkuD
LPNNSTTAESYANEMNLTKHYIALDDKLRLLQSENDLIDEIIKKTLTTEKNQNSFDLVQMQNILKFHRENHERINSEILTIEKEKHDTDDQLKELKKEIRKVTGIEKNAKKAIRLCLS